MFYKKNNIQIIKDNYLDKKITYNINYLFNKFNIPQYILSIALNYLKKLNNINKNIVLYDYIFISIIIALKYTEDYIFNIQNMCNSINYNYDKFKENEIKFLYLINWELFTY